MIYIKIIRIRWVRAEVYAIHDVLRLKRATLLLTGQKIFMIKINRINFPTVQTKLFQKWTVGRQKGLDVDVTQDERNVDKAPLVHIHPMPA